MTHDTQHLDFLISQYVDQTLDATSRKAIEQKIITDPVAANLHKEHRELQDVLDDWGNRLPMIDWDAFDRQLAERLEKEEAKPANSVTPLRRWGRILAAAAALFVAATLGYTYHAMTMPTSGAPQVVVAPIVNPGPRHSVAIMEPTATGPSLDRVQYEQPQTAAGDHQVNLPQSPNGATSSIVVTAPNVLNPGLQGMPARTGSAVSSAGQTTTQPNEFLQQ